MHPLFPRLGTVTIAALLASVFIRADPLKLDYPPPKVTGTPAPVKLVDLEAPNARPPQIEIPARASNLAAGKPATASDPYPVIGDMSLLTDGDKESEDGYYVELGPDLQWVQIDLEQKARIYGIGLWHFHSQARAYHDIIVQISDDPEFKSGVTTVFNNDQDNSSQLGRGKDPAYIEKNTGRLIDARQTVGRYVRLYSHGNTTDSLNHYIEVEIWGVPAP